MKRTMLILVEIIIIFVISVPAQVDDEGTSTLTITANVSGERVRITAPSSVVQMHIEVYAPSGEKLFDQEIRGGNVFDWHLQDGQTQRLVPGAYVCVVTAKSVSGRITQKLGTVTVAEKSASVKAGSPQLSLQQTQAIGPVEADSSWTIAGENEPQTPTVIANNGSEGQMIRGRGALTFRIGNFFSGVDTEQVRLTEAGDLGIGTSTPQSKLDVAGVIRAERFLVVKPKLSGGDKTAAATQTTEGADSVQPLIAGTGTQNQIAKWTDNAGTLGDSGITENGGNVGIGTTSPGAKLEVNGNIYVPNTGGFLANNGQSGMVVRTSGNLDLYNGNAVRVTLDTSGRLGIGTNAPGARLEVNGNIYVVNSGGFLANNGQSGMVVRTAGNLDLYNGNAVKVTVDTAGKVGIGTTSPAVRFHVAGGDLLFENKWRTETTAYTPNLIGGFLGTGSGGATPGNRVTPGVVGATIGGGGFNGSITFPSGGGDTIDNSNSVFDWFGTVAGGFHNRAGSDDATLDNATFATVGGGYYNIARGYVATVGGGYLNTSGDSATVGGGQLNTASGAYSTVPGGISNTAQGARSFAAGSGARANHDGAFVWADSNVFADFASTGNHQFLIRATGGVGIGTNTPSNALSVNGGADFSGGVGIGGILTLGAFGTSGSFPLCRDLFGTISGCPSSLRYKKDVALFAGGLDIINRLRPIAFTWKQGEIRDVGLAAEDVAKVEPLLTFRNEKGEVEGVRYNQLSAVFVNAFKEQQQQIAALRTRLRRLEQALMNRPEAKRRHR